jgi:hypothetical protein
MRSDDGSPKYRGMLPGPGGEGVQEPIQIVHGQHYAPETLFCQAQAFTHRRRPQEKVIQWLA